MRSQIALVEGLSHAATHKECGPSDSGEGLRQVWTAGTYLPPIYELHSLRWTAETGQERTLNQAITSDLGRLSGPSPAIFEFGS